MQAVVKTPRIEINIKGDIPEKLLSLLSLLQNSQDNAN